MRGNSKERMHRWRWHVPTLHCYRIRIGLTRERFVTFGLPSWTHLWTQCWSVFTLQGTRRIASCAWHMELRKLENRWNRFHEVVSLFSLPSILKLFAFHTPIFADHILRLCGVNRVYLSSNYFYPILCKWLTLDWFS